MIEIRKICRFIAQHAVLLAVILMHAGIWPLLRLPDIRVDNAIDVWLDHKSPEYREYVQFHKDYGNDEWVLIGFSIDGIPFDQAMADIQSIVRDLENVNKAITVISVANADGLTLQALGHLLISADKKVAGILLNLGGLGNIENRRDIVRKIEDALSTHGGRHGFHLGGPTLLNAELDRISEHQSRIFMPLAFVVTVLCLYLIFRSFLYTLIALAASGPAVAWTLGTATGLGMTLNMISTVLPVLIWVLSLTGGIHLIHRFRSALNRGESPDQAVLQSLESVLKPYAIAAFTTSIGFLSLLFSHMEPVRDLGIWAAAGIATGFLCNMILMPAMFRLSARYPALLRQLKYIPTSPKGIHPSTVRRHKWLIVFSGLAMMVGPLLLIPSLRVESNVLSFFKEGSRVRKDYDFISQHLTGLSTIEADFRGSPQDCLRYIHSFNEKLLRIPGIRPVVYMSRGSFRMSIFVETMESMDFNILVDDIRAVMAGIDGGGVKVRLTGTVLLLNSIQEELVRTQIKSFGTALLTIILVFVLIFRSAKVVLIGTAVNLLPIAVLAGVAALSNIPLNVATIMIAGVAIGIAVDDTVFFLVRLLEEPGGKESADAAIDSTLRHLTAPITSTTLVITLGFLVLMPSEFRPIQYFGILGGLTMISAWLGDVLLLPALLYAFHPHRGAVLHAS